jgi:hypothetical protein
LSRIIRYALACVGLVGAGSLLAALALEPPDVKGVLMAAAVAVPVQIVAFAALARAEAGSNAFLAAWMGGTLARLVVVGVAAWVLVGLQGLPGAPTLLGLAGFFFAMVLMEPWFLRKA